MISVYYSEIRDKILTVEACERKDTFRLYSIRTSTKELDFVNLENDVLLNELLSKEYVLIGYV